MFKNEMSVMMQYVDLYSQGLGFVSSGNPKDPMFNVNSDNAQLVKAIICGGLYPQVARLKKTQVK